MSENHIVRYLSALTEQGSFSKASQVLDISQPSLSQFVQRLEAESGVTLVDRASRPLTLTFAGECYLRTEKEIERLRDLRDKEIADIAHGVRGRVRLGASQYRSTFFLTEVLPVFRERYPAVEIQLVEGTTWDLEEQVVSGQADLALSLSPLFHAELHCEPLYAEKQYLCLSARDPLVLEHRSGGKEFPILPFESLADHPFILIRKGQQFHEVFEWLCTQTGVRPKVVLESDSPIAALHLASAGVGATLTTLTLAKKAHPAVPVQCFACEPALPDRQVVVAYRNEIYRNKAAEALVEVMREVGRTKFLQA
jgi:DNA-binding transcriptional LysR family regulator